MRSTAKRLAAVAPQFPPTRYAKLTPPRVQGVLARARLFALIGQLRLQHRVIWLAAPPGAGKSTLAASWLEHDRAPAIWCRIDAADADPGTLFFYFSEALRKLDGCMAWQAPDLHSGAAGFARLFFRTFYAALPTGAVLVLDNLQEFDWDNAGQLLEYAFSEVPDGVTLLALSRDTPPARLARLELGGTLTVLDWDVLRAQGDEAFAMAGAGDSADAWVALAAGWPAALAMLRAGGVDAVFRYFEGEVLGPMAAPDRHALLLLSCAPSLAQADIGGLAGADAAPRLMAQLCRTRQFVERSSDGIYQFHPLFGDFLRGRARSELEASALTAMSGRAAVLMEQSGRLDEAERLFQEAGDAAAFARFLVRTAAGMLAMGRGESWRLWLSSLDAMLAQAMPQLDYWHGMSLVELRPRHARTLLMKAEAAFRQSGQRVDQLLAAAAIVDSYEADWADPAGLEQWREVLAAGAEDAALWSDPVALLRVHSRLLCALLAGVPDQARLTACCERTLAAMQPVAQASELLAAGAIVLRYFDMSDNAARAGALITQLAQVEHASALDQVRWLRHVARWYNKEGQQERAQEVMMAARLIGSDGAQDQALHARHLIDTGELAAARTVLDQMMPAAGRALAEWSLLDTHWHALSGHLAGALDAARTTVRFAYDAGMPPSERATCEALLGACLAWQGDFDGAARCYGAAADLAGGVQLALLREEALFIQACAHAQQGDTGAAREALQAALQAHRRRRGALLFAALPQLAARIVALALENEIDSTYAAAIATRQSLVSPHRSVPGWPWPVAVRTLGKFEIALAGTELAPSGKAQQRPLTLLKSLVAAGEGGRTQPSLVSQLWGNADVARSALNVTLHRLRKLLRSDDAVTVAGGRIWLNEAQVWSDVAALDALCLTIASLPAAAPVDDIRRLAASLLALYRGPFCDGIEDSWILPMRDRARNVFLAAVARLGQDLEAGAEWETALGLYQRALEAEPLSEANYRGWMRCARQKDGTAAAFGAYRRCRDTLSIVLGVAPSLETEKLAVSLGLKEASNR
ncbi:BTAD domain-containing putative transcriptional regulator [Massilia sp. CF038]|uniref:BTAD domain-containing putative transcriptional regulator n=1 Tax=Massilia sp. CF038 TaxID=1881045 RepID=UPI000913E3FF|nr:BTAD domain-containing putative transcriptional regulator [Massilia sp. CF038]SHH30227.1 ATP-, maltotriose-and DNA-dependent transcriptional regulator MalT [Massilia sp. CF038]